MRILHLNPPFTGFGGMQGHGGKQAPLNLCYIAAEIRKQFPDIDQEIYDGENLRIGYEEVSAKLVEFKPDLVTMTFPTPAYVTVAECARRVKAYGDIPVVVGGPHPSAFPEQIINEIPEIDICVMGEGERTFSEVAQTIRSGGSLSNVNGITYREGSEARRTGPRDLIKDLDELDFPARDLLPNIKYVSTPTKRVSNRVLGNMITSRGCPYDCTYCESKVIWSRKVRMRSVGNVVDEIQQISERYDIGEINFHDDILPMKRDRTIELSKEMQRRDLDVKWMCMSRVNFVWADVMAEMKKAGCHRVMFGLETGSQTILKNINKKATIEQAYEAVKICRSVGMETMGSFMIGNIGESVETIRETIDFAKKLKLDTASFFVTVPYPGTDLYRQAVEKGYLPAKIEWDKFCVVGNDSGPMQLPGLSNDDLRYWQSKALQEYYLRPSYIFRKIVRMRSLSEIGNLLSGVKLLFSVSKAGTRAKGRSETKPAAAGG